MMSPNKQLIQHITAFVGLFKADVVCGQCSALRDCNAILVVMGLIQTWRRVTTSDDYLIQTSTDVTRVMPVIDFARVADKSSEDTVSALTYKSIFSVFACNPTFAAFSLSIRRLNICWPTISCGPKTSSRGSVRSGRTALLWSSRPMSRKKWTALRSATMARHLSRFLWLTLRNLSLGSRSCCPLLRLWLHQTAKHWITVTEFEISRKTSCRPTPEMTNGTALRLFANSHSIGFVLKIYWQ